MTDEQKKKPGRDIGGIRQFATFGGDDEESDEVEPQSGKTAERDSGKAVKQQTRMTSKLQNRIDAKPQSGKTVKRQNGKAVEPQSGKTAEGEQVNLVEKTTLYLSPDQSDKLDDLAMSYRRRTGKRITRNMLLRKLIDRATLDDIL